MLLPPSSDFNGSSITEGQQKIFIDSVRTFLADLLGTNSGNKVAALTALGAVLNSGLSKAGAYTVAAADKGKVIRCTGTWTLSLTAAATLGDGFAFAVLNEGSGTITIDPNASELVDGGTTKLLTAGKLAIVYCNGTGFTTVGSIATGSGSGLDADLLDGQHGSYYATVTSLSGKVSTNNGHNVVGSWAFLTVSGGVYAGTAYSSCKFAVCSTEPNFGSLTVSAGGAASGTWLAMSTHTSGIGFIGQRIA